MEVSASRGEVWSALLDPKVLHQLIPAADRVEQLDGDRYRAELSFGVGRVRGRYSVGLRLSNVVTPQALDLAGQSSGLLGGGSAVAHVELTEIGGFCTGIAWTYDGVVTGPVAMAGPMVLQASSRLFVKRFFAAFAHHVLRLAEMPKPVTTLTRPR